MSAELFATSEAMSYSFNLKLKNVVIFTDSKSALQHIARCASGHRGTMLAYTVLHKLSMIPTGMTLKLQWIPSHIGLRGNEDADALAKDACTKEHFGERSKEKGMWYKTMQSEPPHLPWFTNSNLSRQLIKIGLRLRSGHIPSKKFAYLMKAKEPSPNCQVCGSVEDVQHILTECARNESDRQSLLPTLKVNRIDVGAFQSILAVPTSEEAKNNFLFFMCTKLTAEMIYSVEFMNTSLYGD
ncbi:uncharacterized protein LOC134756171 [Cydia strobilella]|uniref:uncharacterized protein LOC134756171 n=1 Tax=Cydia strobilella TaxID=1100964 RepID=UPI003004B1E4